MTLPMFSIFRKGTAKPALEAVVAANQPVRAPAHAGREDAAPVFRSVRSRPLSRF